MNKARAGFTLIEMIVTLLIVGIAIAISVTFLTTGANFLNRTEANASDKAVAEKAVDFIKGRLLYASEVEVVKSSSLPADHVGREVLYVGSEDGAALANTGRLFYRNGEDAAPLDVLGGASYRNSELALAYSAIVESISPTKKSAVFEANAMVIRDGKMTQEAEQVFRMYNIGQNSEPSESESVTSWSDSADKQELFYLLVTPAQEGYATTGLVAQFDARDIKKPVNNPNAIIQWKDASGKGNNMTLTFTDNKEPVRKETVYFDGDGDYGFIDNLDLSKYSAVTVEMCFRDVNDEMGMLFEYAKDMFNGYNGYNGGAGMFGAVINSDGSSLITGEIHSVARVGSDQTVQNGSRDFYFTAKDARLKTISFVMSNEKNDNGRTAFIDGTEVEFISAGDKNYNRTKGTEPGTGFGEDYTFSVAARKVREVSFYYTGEIAAVRIYGRALNADEIAKNAETDMVNFS
jgi:prepilin-type N-terminal cleavage/methylation domain-containing protein